MTGKKTGRTNYGPSKNAERLAIELTQLGPQTREELAERLEVSESTIDKARKRLNRANSSPRVRESVYGTAPEDAQLPPHIAEKHASRPGPTPEVLMLGRNAGRVIGIEIGHGHLSVGIGDANGCLLGGGESEIHEKSHSIEEVPPRETFELIAKMVKAHLKRCKTRPGEIRAVAVSIPGPVSIEGRTLSNHVLATYDGVDIPRDLGAALEKLAALPSRTPTFVENDVDVLARGEHRYGKGFGLRDFAVVKCSGGVGSAIVSNERVVRGRSGGGAGEIGHCVIKPQMLSGERKTAWDRMKVPKCRCEGWGHLEAYAGGEAIIRRIRELEMQKRKRKRGTIPKEGPLSSQIDVAIKYAQKEDGFHRQVIGDAAALVGLAVNTLIHLFNPELLLICGKFSEMGETFLDHIHQECRAHGLLFGNVADIVHLGTGSTVADRRRIGVRGAVTTALRKSTPPLNYTL